jgi:hypothetical protein
MRRGRAGISKSEIRTAIAEAGAKSCEGRANKIDDRGARNCSFIINVLTTQLYSMIPMFIALGKF